MPSSRLATEVLNQMLSELGRHLRGELVLEGETATLRPHDAADIQAAVRYLHTQAASGLPVPSLVPYGTLADGIALKLSPDLMKANYTRGRVASRAILSNGDEISVQPLTPAQLEARRQHQTFEGKIYRALNCLDLGVVLMNTQGSLAIVTEVRDGDLQPGALPVDYKEAKRLFDPYGFLNPQRLNL